MLICGWSKPCFYYFVFCLSGRRQLNWCWPCNTLSLQAGFFLFFFFFLNTQQALFLADITVGRPDQCLEGRKTVHFIHIHSLVPCCERREAQLHLKG